MKRALVTGCAGQDGSLLAEHLLGLGYQLYGLVRRDARGVAWVQSMLGRVEFLGGDLRDVMSLETAVRKSWPDELYNLGAQVFVPQSWMRPAETFDVNVGGLARILEIIEAVKPDIRVYQASSSEMFGNQDGPCNETTPFCPESPYGASKLAAHNLVQIYRRKGLYVVSGICGNHESPRRGLEMVTRKIARAAARWSLGDETPLELGNLDARRDWGFAGDYVRAMRLMLQQDEPKDYVIGTGESHSVRDFLKAACWAAGMAQVPEHRVRIGERLVRKNEIRRLVMDASRARKELGWEPTVRFEELVKLMVESEIERHKKAYVEDRRTVYARAGGED